MSNDRGELKILSKYIRIANCNYRRRWPRKSIRDRNWGDNYQDDREIRNPHPPHPSSPSTHHNLITLFFAHWVISSPALFHAFSRSALFTSLQQQQQQSSLVLINNHDVGVASQAIRVVPSGLISELRPDRSPSPPPPPHSNGDNAFSLFFVTSFGLW